MRNALVLVLALATFRGAFAAAPPALGSLVKQRRDSLQVHTDPQLDELNLKLSRANADVHSLTQPLLTDDDIDELMQETLYDRRANGAGLRRELELSLIRDPAQRAELLKQAKADALALSTQVARLRAPYDRQAQTTRRAIAASDKSYGEALTAFLRDSNAPKLSHGPFAVTSSQAIATWKDQDGNDALKVTITLNQNSNLWYPLNREKLDDKYVIGVYATPRFGEEQASVKIGTLCITVFAFQDQFKGDNTRLLNLLKTIVDLDALAAVKVD